MKHLITILLLTLALGTTTFAQTSPKDLLLSNATSQSRQGWLGLGTFGTNQGPLATLDVRGTTIADSLKVLGNAIINNRLSIGGTWGSTAGNGLKVSNGTIRVSSYGGQNKRTLCIQPNGTLLPCATTSDVTDKCSNITGFQGSLPYTYYEEPTGRKIVVEANPSGSTTCKRTAAYTAECSDGIDSNHANDTDTAIDAADGNCYVPLSPSIPNFLNIIKRPVLKIGTNWYVYDPMKNAEWDPQSQVCGNNTIESPEQCDDGNTSNTDACTNSCTKTSCGDGIVQTPNGYNGSEQCDDANTSNTDECNNSCILTFCGDGIVQGGSVGNGSGIVEQCDNGSANGTAGGCSSICQNPTTLVGFICTTNFGGSGAGFEPIKCKPVLNTPSHPNITNIATTRYWNASSARPFHVMSVPSGSTTTSSFIVHNPWSFSSSPLPPAGAPWTVCYNSHTPSSVSLIVDDDGSSGTQVTVNGNPNCFDI